MDAGLTSPPDDEISLQRICMINMAFDTAPVNNASKKMKDGLRVCPLDTDRK
jgi:hypothetical protein